ncbi:MAG TPA: PH domain-containing protein [Galbitalea sp.]|nr:PH domain-containing protein [Galbitalea sp.]
MLDFKSTIVFKLNEIKPEEGLELVQPMLLEDERIFAAFKTIRDHVIFTNHRIIAVNVEGITGKMKDYTSLPYVKVQAFSVRTASLLAMDTIMDVWFNSMGIVTFEFSGHFDIAAFNKLIGQYILKAPAAN